MGSTLFGGEKSGTPKETRGAVNDLAKYYQTLMSQGGPGALGQGFGRMATESMVNMLGFDPSQLGLDEASIAALMDPADSTAGLFAAMQPFEAQETANQVAGLRDAFGTMGGRFSRNMLTAEGQARGELAGRFQQNRQQALLQAGAQRTQALLGIMGAAQQARQQAFQEQVVPWQMMQNYLQPGAPVYTQGMMPGLLQLGGTLAGMHMMRPGGK